MNQYRLNNYKLYLSLKALIFSIYGSTKSLICSLLLIFFNNSIEIVIFHNFVCLKLT